MITKIHRSLFLFCTLISIIQFSFAQKKESNNLSFTTFNHRGEVKQGFWFATTENEKICLQLMDSKNRKNPSFIIGLCIPKDEFTVNNEAGFELTRPPGTIKFEGEFPLDKGNGDFTFIKNTDFETFLKKEGITTKEENRHYYFKLFLGDVSKNYVLGLKKLGYYPNLKQLGKLGIHNVSLAYINSLSNTNYKGLELDMLLKFAIHDVSISYIKDLERAGYGNIDANMLKKFAIHNVTSDYIDDLASVGYGNLEANMIKNFAVHNISIEYIKSLSTVGFSNLEPGMLKKFAVYDIDPKYITSIREAGIENPDPNTIRKAKIHGLTANYIKKAKAGGHNSKELSDYIRLKIHGK